MDSVAGPIWGGKQMVDFDCVIEDCTRVRHYSNGYCSAHYRRFKSGKDLHHPPLKPEKNPRPLCTVWGCESRAKNSKSQGLCPRHLLRMQRAGRTFSTVTGKWEIPICTITGCEAKRHARGLCANHAARSVHYKLTAIQLDMIYRKGACDSCGKALSMKEGHIDHDHACCDSQYSCGECIRGLLCSGCNVGLGAFGDSPEVLRGAARYLEATKKR